MILGKNTKLKNMLLAKRYLKDKGKWTRSDDLYLKHELSSQRVKEYVEKIKNRHYDPLTMGYTGGSENRNKKSKAPERIDNIQSGVVYNKGETK